MRTLRNTIILLSVFMAATSLAAEETPVPFVMPVLDGWRTETIPFPLEFAPDLPYAGLEELRFAPGMFEKDSEEFWTYAFVWWVEPDGPADIKSLSTYLENYFRGLSVAVAKTRDVELGDAKFSASLETGDGPQFWGVAETFDAFVTHDRVRLNIRGDMWQCTEANRRVIFFALSPQAMEHSVWSQLDSVRTGFRCAVENDEPKF